MRLGGKTNATRPKAKKSSSGSHGHPNPTPWKHCEPAARRTGPPHEIRGHAQNSIQSTSRTKAQTPWNQPGTRRNAAQRRIRLVCRTAGAQRKSRSPKTQQGKRIGWNTVHAVCHQAKKTAKPFVTMRTSFYACLERITPYAPRLKRPKASADKATTGTSGKLGTPAACTPVEPHARKISGC